MFSDFEKAFKKNDTEKVIPREVIEALSEKLPEGFKYVDVGEGACTIASTASEFTININVEFPDGFTPSSPQELMEYIYRSQCELNVKADSEGFIKLNGTKIKVNDLIRFPLEDVSLKESKFTIRPAPFKPFKVPLEGSNTKTDVLMMRQPYSDMKKSLFKNIDSNVFEISYLVDEAKQSINLHVNINIENSTDIAEILKGLKLYKLLLIGQLKFAGINLCELLNDKHIDTNEKAAISKTINFWGKVLDLQKILNVKFIPQYPVTYDNAMYIEKLYRSLIKKEPYKEFININTLTTTSNEKMDWDQIKDAPGMAFQFVQNNVCENIWGIELQLSRTIGLFDMKVKDIVVVDQEEDQYVYDLVVEPLAERKIYMSCQYFIDEAAASMLVKQVEKLQNAELICL